MTAVADVAIARLAAELAVSEVTSESGFDAIESDWDSVVDRLEVPSPFQGWTWNRSWWRRFGMGGSLRILVFREHGEVAGIAPLYERRYGLGKIVFRVLAPIGREIRSRDQDLTEQLELLFPRGQRGRLMIALSAWLERASWSGLLLPDLQDGDTIPHWLEKRLVFSGQRAPFRYRELPPTWEELVSSLRKSTRDNVKYYPRLLTRHGHAQEFQVARTPDDVSACLPVFLDLHRARADFEGGQPHGDRFWSADCRAFVHEVLPPLAAKGQVAIGLLRVAGAPVAAQLWFEQAQVMFLYYSGYRPEWAKYSVAFIATQEALKDAMARGVRRVEFLRGGGQFKERWGGSARYRSTAVFGRRPGLVKMLVAARTAQRRAKSRLKSLKG